MRRWSEFGCSYSKETKPVLFCCEEKGRSWDLEIIKIRRQMLSVNLAFGFWLQVIELVSESFLFIEPQKKKKGKKDSTKRREEKGGHFLLFTWFAAALHDSTSMKVREIPHVIDGNKLGIDMKRKQKDKDKLRMQFLKMIQDC